MTDFESTSIEIVERRKKYKTRHRDHGHRPNVLNSFEGTLRGDGSSATTPERVAATALLFLGVKNAIDQNKPLVVSND
jgi:hypothetical protein